MPLKGTIEATTKSNVANDATQEKEGRRRLGSGLIVGFHAFVVAYAVLAVSFDHWGSTLGWMPSALIAAAFGRFGYCLPWIDEAIVMPWEMLSIFTWQPLACERGYLRYVAVLDDQTRPSNLLK